MKKLFSKEVIIGLLVVICLVILFVGIDFLKGINVFKATNYYYVSFTNVEGLAQSAPVTVNGFKVGLVRDIQYEYDNPGHVRVELDLDKSLRVPVGTKATLATDLLGTATIALEMPLGVNKYCAVGDHLEGVNPVGMMENVTQDLLPAVSGIMPKIDTLLTSINRVVSAPEITASVQRLDAITANLEATSRQLNALMRTLPPITANVTTITANAATASDALAVLSADLKEMPLDSLMDNLTATSQNLRQLSADLANPNSTLGMLMTDPALYRNANAAVASLDSLLRDVKLNPKRYISIKLL